MRQVVATRTAIATILVVFHFPCQRFPCLLLAAPSTPSVVTPVITMISPNLVTSSYSVCIVTLDLVNSDKCLILKYDPSFCEVHHWNVDGGKTKD